MCVLLLVLCIFDNAFADQNYEGYLGDGVGRVMKLGGQPMNISLSAFYNVKEPDDIGSEWSMRLNVQFLFHKSG